MNAGRVSSAALMLSGVAVGMTWLGAAAVWVAALSMG